MRHLEDAEAVALIRWRDLHAKKYPELALLFAIPNGGKRNAREAARLKRMGVKAGVSDYLLPVSNDEFPEGDDARHGLWLELKAAKGRLSQPQVDWLNAMEAQGYATCAPHGWVEAARAIAKYLALPAGVAP